MNAGKARASGYVGQANALSGALNSVSQTVASLPLLKAQVGYYNSLSGGGGGGGGVNNFMTNPQSTRTLSGYPYP
jgi:hypothetical protein